MVLIYLPSARISGRVAKTRKASEMENKTLRTGRKGRNTRLGRRCPVDSPKGFKTQIHKPHGEVRTSQTHACPHSLRVFVF